MDVKRWKIPIKYKCSQGHIFIEESYNYYIDNICPKCWQYAEPVKEKSNDYDTAEDKETAEAT